LTATFPFFSALPLSISASRLKIPLPSIERFAMDLRESFPFLLAFLVFFLWPDFFGCFFGTIGVASVDPSSVDASSSCSGSALTIGGGGGGGGSG
jgi:hypothetical protein